MSRTTPGSRGSLLAVLLLVAGCAPKIDGCSIFPPNGLAGNGSFQYDCVGADPECDDRAIFAVGGELPKHPVARGSSFRLTYLSKTTPVKPVSTNSVSTTAASIGEAFTVKRAGSVGFFVDADEAGQIEDAVRLRVSEADRIFISRAPAGIGETSMLVGNSLDFRATATAKGETLAGALSVTWEIDDTGVAELEPKPFGGCTVRGMKAGKVKLRARFETFADQLEVVVTPVVDDDFDAGNDSSADSSIDANAEAGDAKAD